MRTQFTLLVVLGALVAVPAAAQEPSRATRPASERRIMVSKGDVALPPRVDTVYVTRYDTVYATKVETVRVPVRVVHVDTVLVPVSLIPSPVQRSPIYAGFYTGATLPSGNIDRLYTNGFHLGAVVGWDGDNQLFGMRMNGDFAQINREQGRPVSVVGTTTPLMLSLGLDGKVMPFRSRSFQLYGIGGGTLGTSKGIAMVAEAGQGVPDGMGGFNRAVTNANWRTTYGFNFGGGVDFLFAGQELFFETRAVALHANGARTWFVPVSLGLRYF